MSVNTRRVDRRRGGPPLFTYVHDPAAPPVSVVRVDRATRHRAQDEPHTHDFPALVYFERGGGFLHQGGEVSPIDTGDLFVIAPGDVVGLGERASLADAAASGVFFTPEALGPDRPGPLLSWRAHPLLFPFVRGSARGITRLRVPVEERRAWVTGIDAIETELAECRDGYRHAALAHLVLLLVSVARLANDVSGDLRLNNEGLLADVFAVIERRYSEQLSLADVARAVSLSPGHLTTTVRRRTGRTVQDWITERRMTEARRLLSETELSIAEIGRAVGYPDSGYFARVFRRGHAVPPREWRRRD
ncbi:AraC family transcriptional regulator [Pseudonocardia spinosispora]|uniref:AraC family transcriptional regulator n=1 Tax=Pseudonocardia spinosispora TaxID=103441 RepID=UPI0006845C35|nr:AraC family transcriptional regulator [Pseudonocardia spinosispora]